MNKQEPIRYIPLAITIFLLAIISPLFLIPIEKLFPYPYVVEELIKVAGILLILKMADSSFQTKLAIIFSLLFSLSESIFYLPNFTNQSFFEPFIQRIFLTGMLHTLTILIILFSAKKKRWLLFISVPFAMFIHYLYNILIVNFFNRIH
jgi:hypothetical protein